MNLSKGKIMTKRERFIRTVERLEVDVQHLMTQGTPQQVREEVIRLRKLFPSGLILSPAMRH
jgi:hypothetical protein